MIFLFKLNRGAAESILENIFSLKFSQCSGVGFFFFSFYTLCQIRIKSPTVLKVVFVSLFFLLFTKVLVIVTWYHFTSYFG